MMLVGMIFVLIIVGIDLLVGLVFVLVVLMVSVVVLKW